MQILFYDPMTPYAYDATMPLTQALGGTEATVIRVAESLKKHHSVAVAQQCRSQDNLSDKSGVHYLSFEAAQQLKPDVVILLRQYRKLEEVAQCFPKAKRYLWLHNMPSRELYAAREALIQHRYQVLAVSRFHRTAIDKRLQGKWFQRLLSLPHSRKRQSLPIEVIYNPIDDALRPDATPVQANRLLFMSSPHKGLAETLRLFTAIQQEFPEYELLIANPGYNNMALSLPKQARFLGALPHPQIIQELRQAFCVFYPQAVRVETFGLVYAEANAVGTPVLAHDAGAAREVLSHAGQLVNGRSLFSVLDKLAEWREKRPQLQGKEEFRLNRISQRWLRLLS